MVLLGAVGVAVLLAGSSVGVLVSVVEADSVDVNSVLEDVDAVGVGEEPVDEASVVAAVAVTGGMFCCWQRASRTHGGHMCGERQRSAVFDDES